MSAAPSSSTSDRKPSIDVRTLSMAQLQKLANKGSRRARAELEKRLSAPTSPAPLTMPPTAPAPLSPAPAKFDQPAVTAQSATGHRASHAPGHVASYSAGQSIHAPQHAPVHQVPHKPHVTPHPAPHPHHAQAPLPGGLPSLSTPPLDATHEPPSPQQALATQLTMIAQQDERRARASGTPKLLGMMLMGWSVLMLLGGLAMLRYSGGAYYLVSGMGTLAVGWLLLHCNRIALVVQPAILLVALAWAWHDNKGSLVLMLVQTTPLLIPAMWMLLQQAREPLE